MNSSFFADSLDNVFNHPPAFLHNVPYSPVTSHVEADLDSIFETYDRHNSSNGSGSS